MFSRQSQSILPPCGLIPAEAVTRRDRERRKSYRIARLIRFVTAGESSSSRWKKWTQESFVSAAHKDTSWPMGNKAGYTLNPKIRHTQFRRTVPWSRTSKQVVLLEKLGENQSLIQPAQGTAGICQRRWFAENFLFFVVLKWVCDEQPSDLRIINNGRSPPADSPQRDQGGWNFLIKTKKPDKHFPIFTPASRQRCVGCVGRCALADAVRSLYKCVCTL